MLLKILKSNIEVSQLVGAFLGALIGLSFLIFSMQFYLNIIPSIKNEEGLWKPEYIIVSKKVSMIKSLNKKKNEFSKEEIEEIKNQEFVSEVAVFKSNAFKVKAFNDGSGNMQVFRVDMFFEAIPDEYIDIKNKDKWVWKNESDIVPIIIPKSYLALYNFGFAESQNLPQISESAVTMFAGTLVLEGKGNKGNFDGQICGLSERINSLLVPESFLDWANEKYGNYKKDNPSRLIMVVKNPSDPRLASFIKSKNYQINTEKLKSSKIISFLNIVSTVISIIGVVITILAVWLLIISFQLLIQKNKDRIYNLYIIGYKLGKVSRFYTFIMLTSSIIITFLAMLIVIYTQPLYLNHINNAGFSVTEGLSAGVVIFAIGFMIVMCTTNIILLKHQFRKIIT